jgi:chorismate mutase/prephenate dehydratase
MTDKRREVEELRQEMAKIDAQLLVRLERRGKLSKKVGEARKSLALPISIPERTQIDAIVSGAENTEIPMDGLREIFREILATCYSLESPVVVAYCGVEGAFAHTAARSRFGAAAVYTACDSVAAALDEVTRQRASYAVVPYETRAEGVIQTTIASLTTSELKIVGCFEAVVNLQLCSRTTAIGDIEKVYATALDRAQSQRFLEAELPGAVGIDVKSPEAACQLAATEPRSAALAHVSVAAHHGLENLRRNVLDEGDERVRYAMIGTRPSSRSGNDLTAIVFAVSDSPGALHEALEQFAERGVNLTKIQSRPTPGETWQYLFFIEVRGHATDRPIVGAIEEVRRHAKFFKVLGSYTTT